MRCAIAGCHTDYQSKNFTSVLMFFRFPKDKNLSKQWENACKRADKINVKNARICSKHFDEDCYERNLKFELLGYSCRNRRLLKPEAIPILNLPNKSTGPLTSNRSRDSRLDKRNRTKFVENIIAASGSKCDGIQVCNIVNEGAGASNVIVANEDTKLQVNIGTNTDIDERDEIISKLKKENEELKNENLIFRKIFTQTQINKLKQPKKRVIWTVEDISKAIVIHSAGGRAYRLLLKKGYPLPCVSTLRGWCKKIKLEPGILKKVLMIVKRGDLTEVQKLCVLAFDEIKTKSIYLYDKANDETLKPYNYIQVATLRGLFGNWKQPIFYDYDCQMTKKKLFEIITHAEDAGFPVIAIVSDLGGGNRGLHKQLGITTSQTWFISPANNRKVYVFADVPHLIKLLRNHFVDDGFILNGKEINKTIIEKLIHITSSTDLNIAHKISLETLNVKNAQRQKVKFATKLFSHTISRAISRCGMLGEFEDEDWFVCAEFFKDVNDWFDCLNVKVPEEDNRERKKAFGLSLHTQTDIIDKMSNIMSSLRVKGKKSILPFQTGILITNSSIKLLYQDLKIRYNIKYILTYRLNQDVLENFFSVIRSRGGLHDHPNPLEFKYRLRAYILGRNEGSLTVEGNTEKDETPDLQSEELLSNQYFHQLTSDETYIPICDSLDQELDAISYDGLQNLAGFICHKLKKAEPTSTNTVDSSLFSWTDHLSEGGLSKPSDEMMQHMEELEKIFTEVNSDQLLISKGYLSNLLHCASNIDCSTKIKQLFFKSRMFFRIRNLNKSLQSNHLSKKRKMLKIVS